MRTNAFPLLPSCAMLLLAACSGPAPDPNAAKHAEMMKADSAAKAEATAHEAAFRKVFEMFNTGNTDGMEEVVAADFVDHQKDASVTSTGIQGAKEMVTLIRTWMPDFHQEWLDASTTGDRTYVHYRMTGTNTGPWGEMKPTGKAVDVMGVDVVRFADGKMVEHWGYSEDMKMMQQLGMMPAPGEEEKK